MYVLLNSRTRTQMGVFDNSINARQQTLGAVRTNQLDTLTCRMTDHVSDTQAKTAVELITNGQFATNTTGWAAAASALSQATVGAVAQLSITNSGAAEGSARDSFTTVIGDEYSLQFDFGNVLANDSGSVSVNVGTAAGGAQVLSRTFGRKSSSSLEVRFIATATTTHVEFGTNSAVNGALITLDNIRAAWVPTEADMSTMAIFTCKEFGAPWVKTGGAEKVIHYVAIAGTACPTNTTILFPNFNYDPMTMTVRT